MPLKSLILTILVASLTINCTFTLPDIDHPHQEYEPNVTADGVPIGMILNYGEGVTKDDIFFITEKGYILHIYHQDMIVDGTIYRSGEMYKGKLNNNNKSEGLPLMIVKDKEEDFYLNKDNDSAFRKAAGIADSPPGVPTNYFGYVFEMNGHLLAVKHKIIEETNITAISVWKQVHKVGVYEEDSSIEEEALPPNPYFLADSEITTKEIGIDVDALKGAKICYPQKLEGC